MANNGGGQQVAMILYKEIVEGDLRKILAKSNDSETGGGARDFRFGSYSQLEPAIKQMFPHVVKESRKRDGKTALIDVFKGEFLWHNSKGGVERKDSFFEPPNDVRPSEGRIARVPEYGCFDANLLPTIGVHGNRVLLLLIQRKDGTVWPYYAEEKTLRTTGKWDAAVAKELIACLDAQRPEKQAVIGYRDFTNASVSRYCNGK